MIDVVFAMMLRCVTITPQGVPVDPDVNIKDARSSSAMSGMRVSVLRPDARSSLRETPPRLVGVPSARSVTTGRPDSGPAYLESDRASMHAHRGVVAFRNE